MNQIQWPKISIVTPCYNSARYIEPAIRSVLDQGYPELEYIVMDGGSTDGTVEIIKKYEDRIKWRSEKDHGQTEALNKGFALSTGQILAWLNADEEYLPGAFFKVAERFRSDPALELVFGDRIKIDVNYNILQLDRLPRLQPKALMLYTYGLLYSDTTFWRRELHDRTGTLDEVHYPQLAMDYDWFLRLSTKVRKWAKIDAYLSVFKEREDRKTSQATAKECSGRWIRNQVLKEQRISGPLLLAAWFYYGFRRRLQMSGLRGLFWRPKLSTFLRIMGVTD